MTDLGGGFWKVDLPVDTPNAKLTLTVNPCPKER
jgi:hypothetical protein